MRLGCALSLVLLVFGGHEETALAQSPGSFTPTGSMTMPRFSHTSTLLADGRVLIAGGNIVCYIGPPSCLRPDRAELYDPATGTFTATVSMTTAYAMGAVLLPDGKVLIGGYDITQTTASVEVYDPLTGGFNTAGKPVTLTAVYSATLLNDGRVLLTGRVGNPPSLMYGAELYDPIPGTFSPIANWPGQDTWVPVVLASGRVLLVTDESTSNSEIYDPATGTFSLTGSLGYFDGVPHETLLLNGRVSFTGGNDIGGNVSRTELYDPATGTFASTGSMTAARNSHSATLLPDGTVLVAGGAGQSMCGQPPLASVEIYDPATPGFSTTGSLASARLAHTATLLKNGQVLITGGEAFTAGCQPFPNGTPINGISSAELYTPAVLVPAPVLFSVSGDGRGQGAIWHAQTGQIASPDSPAAAGEALSMYTTSLSEGGVISPQVAVGARLAEVLYFGPAPGYPGYYQVNFRVPASVARGPSVPVRFDYLNRPSNEVSTAVQ